MSFKLSEDAVRLYDKITKGSTSKRLDLWDFYYYCLLVGFSKCKLTEGKFNEFNRGYTSGYSQLKPIFVGLLISTDLKRTGMDFTKENITKKFSDLVDTDSSLVFNESGLNLMNQYANGGFEYIMSINPGINDVRDFIDKCYDLINGDQTESVN